MHTIPVVMTDENFARVIVALDRNIGRLEDDDGNPIETDDELVHRFLRAAVSGEVFGAERGIASGAVVRDDSIVEQRAGV